MPYSKEKPEVRRVVGFRTSGICTLLSGMAEPTGDHGDVLLHNHGTMEDFNPHYMSGSVRVQERGCLSFASGHWVAGRCGVPAFDSDGGGGSWVARFIIKPSTVPILLPLLLS